MKITSQRSEFTLCFIRTTSLIRAPSYHGETCSQLVFLFLSPPAPSVSLPSSACRQCRPCCCQIVTEHVQCGKEDLCCSSQRTHLPSRSGPRWASILPQTSLSFWLPLPKLSSFVPPNRPMICLLFGPQPPIHVPQESRQKRKRHRPEPFAQTDCGKATIKRCWAWMELRWKLSSFIYSLCLKGCPPLSISAVRVEGIFAYCVYISLIYSVNYTIALKAQHTAAKENTIKWRKHLHHSDNI